MRFEWDPAKDLANQRKHDVSFEEAAELFTVIRIIGTRWATGREERQYRE